MSYTSIEDFSTIKKNKDYTGAELFSLIIPPGINVNRPTLKIKNGQLIDGRLSKDVLGAKKKNNLIQLIWDGYGVDDTKAFIDNTQRLINNFNLWHGFSVGVGDVYVPNDVNEQIEKMFQTKELKVEHMITEMENNPEFMPQELFEHRLFSELNIVRDDVSKLIMGNLTPTNAFNVMTSSGSKGDATNIGQMAGCLGLQAFEGKIVPKKYNNRTLAYYHQHDDRASSRGLVKQSFIKGLEFPEYVFHLMASRIGLIDTAIKSVTGDTPIVIQEDGETKRVLIGDWIDEKMKSNKNEIKYESEKEMELLEVSNKIYIPTCDDDGNVSWEIIKAVTRHDPTDDIYKIKTYGGREVIVADSKSLLIWDDDAKTLESKLTRDVKLGDFVPVTHTLKRPKIIRKTIDMTKYFSREEYLYGTDYHLADKMIKESIKNSPRQDGKTVPGFWKEHNGSTFTVPFWRAADLMRSTSGRSNTESIKDGFLYSFSKSREHGLPEKFPLTRENGVFIGLFLADGNADIPSGYVQITKKNMDIQNFTVDWFNKMGINWTKTIDQKTVGKNKNVTGTTEVIRGYSVPLGKFLTKLVGHMSENKYVPHEAYDAPDEFIIGLLDGYFSGDGTVSRSGITVGSVSRVLIEGISMLCSRLGIFGRIRESQQEENNLGTENILPMNTFTINSKWAKIFCDKISLTNGEKNDKLEDVKCTEEHINFDTYNDVVLDKIISIEKCDTSKYKKMYDLTVPKTLNFQIGNGMNCRDTAETGKILPKNPKYL
jgi:hypothetical protein